jgi:hypothetical protein
LLLAAGDTVGYVGKTQRNTWIAEYTKTLMQEERETKQRYQERHKVLKTEVHRKVGADKQKQLDEVCNELETAIQKGICGNSIR